MACCGKQRKQFKDQVAANKPNMPKNILDPIPPHLIQPPQPQLSPRALRIKNRLARIAGRQARAAAAKAQIEEASKKNQALPPNP